MTSAHGRALPAVEPEPGAATRVAAWSAFGLMLMLQRYLPGSFNYGDLILRGVLLLGVAIGYGTEGHPDFWITRWESAEPQREMHLAFQAPDVEAVRAFHATAVELGLDSLHEPRLWPEYHPGYYGAFVRDPDGNNVEAVFHRASPDA